MTWNLTGTEEQKAIIREGFTKIHFPFEQLKLPGTPELGWMDLNSGMFRVHADHAHETPDAPQHGEGDSPEPLVGKRSAEDTRNYVLGVFYPGSARIYIDSALVDYPEVAQATLSAEIAHAVDEFMPLTDEQRDQIMLELHGGQHDEHSWWEKVDYSAEYFSLVGETFMILFTKAYSDIPFGSSSDFAHSGDNITAERIRQLVGVERTDSRKLVRYGKSKVYHRPTHYPTKTNGIAVTDTAGLRPCKVCKP